MGSYKFKMENKNNMSEKKKGKKNGNNYIFF